MLQLHDAKHFKFDGEEKKEWLIINTTNDTSFQMGRNKSVQTESGIISPIFKGINNNLPSLTFEILKVNFNGEPTKMTKEDIFELNRWLDRNVPKSLEVNGFIYYGIFSPQNGLWYTNKFGRIELRFDMTVPYMYGPVVKSIYKVKENKMVEITNKSNVYGEMVHPDIEIKMLSGDNVTIKNMTNGQIIILSDLKVNNVYKIYNQERQIINLTNVKDNVYANSNKTFINLVYGTNRFIIDTNGEIDIKFIYQPKICLQ